VLEVTEIKTVPYVPLSHPFVERIIGTLRRECLDRTLFWTTTGRRSYSISNITIMSIARTPDAKGALRCRVSTQIAHEQISVVIADFSNSPPTRSPHPCCTRSAAEIRSELWLELAHWDGSLTGFGLSALQNLVRSK
jgi:hypothetical protein